MLRAAERAALDCPTSDRFNRSPVWIYELWDDDEHIQSIPHRRPRTEPNDNLKLPLGGRAGLHSGLAPAGARQRRIPDAVSAAASPPRGMLATSALCGAADLGSCCSSFFPSSAVFSVFPVVCRLLRLPRRPPSPPPSPSSAVVPVVPVSPVFCGFSVFCPLSPPSASTLPQRPPSVHICGLDDNCFADCGARDDGSDRAHHASLSLGSALARTLQHRVPPSAHVTAEGLCSQLLLVLHHSPVYETKGRSARSRGPHYVYGWGPLSFSLINTHAHTQSLGAY